MINHGMTNLETLLLKIYSRNVLTEHQIAILSKSLKVLIWKLFSLKRAKIKEKGKEEDGKEYIHWTKPGEKLPMSLVKIHWS